MRTVTVEEAASRLPDLIAEVEAGATIQFTRQGQVVAQLGPRDRRRSYRRPRMASRF